MADDYPDGTRATAPGWHAVKRKNVWWGGDFRGIHLGENWEVPAYAVITLPNQPITDPAEIAARVFAKRREIEAAQSQTELCDAWDDPNEDDPFGWFCNREAGHPDEDGDGGHHWV